MSLSVKTISAFALFSLMLSCQEKTASSEQLIASEQLINKINASASHGLYFNYILCFSLHRIYV